MVRASFCSGLLFLLSVTSVEGAAVIDAALARHEAQRLDARDSRVFKVILEVNKPEHFADALRSSAYARLRYLTDTRLQFEISPGRLAQFAATMPAGSVLRLPYPNAPHAVSQGVELTGASAMHALGARGSGLRIGVIDLGFAGLGAAQAAGELPADTVVLDYTGTGATTGTNHGTQVAQIVHDMAPQAELHLAKIDSDVELQLAVNDMIEAGVQVINHSVGWYGAAFYDGSGPICAAVNTAAANGIQWVNSAGNDRMRHYLGTFAETNGDLRHEFSAGQDYNAMTLGPGGSARLVLNWDAYPTTSVDYDLYLYDGLPGAGGVIVARSENRQSGRGPARFPYPIETLQYLSSSGGTYYVVVTKIAAATAHLPITLFSLGSNLSVGTTASSLSQPADCANSLTVAATNLNDSVEGFSAEGPTTDGRPKPDLAAPNRVVTTLNGSFAGTSAAAPHVAGAVALVIERLGLSPQEAAVNLLATLKDVHASGFDYRSGGGRLSLDADGDGWNHDADNCPLVVNPAQADLDGDGVGNACDEDIDGDGLGNGEEGLYGTDLYAADSDGDDVSDYDEIFVYGTDPLNLDTDGDGVGDYDELFVYGTDPLSPRLIGDLAPTDAPDGVVNVADLMRLVRFTAGLETPTVLERRLADVNGDGDLDVRDVLEMTHMLGY